jgi:ubiquinone/menaquinone biosynthesis C-methylase UbiE
MSKKLWEEKYRNGYLQLYPWDVIVSFIFNNIPANKPRNDIHILEVGCGTASNLWFAAREGIKVSGIDCSESAINYAKKRFQQDGLNGDLKLADFRNIPFADECFDFVIDRASITSVGYSQAHMVFNEIERVLKKGGKFFFNPYSDQHSSYISGKNGDDGVKLDIANGSLMNVGQICFYNMEQVVSALKIFKIINIEHMERKELYDDKQLIHAEWRAIAEKIN